jgi:hypothetical protein
MVAVAARKSSSRARRVQLEYAHSVPLKLNQGREPAIGADKAHAETLGTLAFTHPFEQCLAAALRAETAEDYTPCDQWYKSPYVVSRLQKHIGSKLLKVVLAKKAALERLKASTDPSLNDWRVYRRRYEQTEQAIHEAVARLGFTHREVKHAERQLMKLLQTQLIRYKPAGR